MSIAMTGTATRHEEALLWSARPDPARFAASRRGAALLALPVLALGAVMAAPGGAGLLAALPMLAIGGVLLASAMIAPWQARAVTYGVTRDEVVLRDATPLLGGERRLARAALGAPEVAGDAVVLRHLGGCAGGACVLEDMDSARLAFAGLADPAKAAAELRAVLAAR